MESRHVIILGTGPAGYTAALYTARANLNPLVIAGNEPGGQLTLTTEVENFPGFPEGIMGPELMDNMRAQAEKFGAEFKTGLATSVDLSQRPFKVVVDAETEYQADTLIIATGATARLIGLANEKRLIGAGVSTCATCDGWFFRGKKIAVVGGGDSAMEEAIFLTKFASEVNLIHRRAELRASKVMQDRARANPKIKWHLNQVPIDVLGENKVNGIRLQDAASGAESELELDGIFIAIGHRPNTDFLAGQLKLDEDGYIVTRGTRTSVEGVFAAGDVQDRRYRQAVTAAGSGCAAALDAEKWLEGDMSLGYHYGEAPVQPA